MDNITYNIIIGSTRSSLAFGTIAGTLVGILKGIHDREFVTLRSGVKCVLRNFTHSLTLASITSVAFAIFILIATNTSPITFTTISAISVCAFLYGRLNTKISKSSYNYQQTLRLFFDRSWGQA